jgi:hypothetical protein
MKKVIVLLLLASATQWGCEFIGGAATGALATGAGYEYQSHRQQERLEDDLRSGRISREEYRDRKQQIERGSLIY